MTASHHPANVNHVTSHKINRNKNITVVAHGHSLMVNRDVLYKTAVATHARSGITFPLFAVLSQHVGSRSLHLSTCPNHNRRLNKRVHRLKNDDELDDETEFVYKGTNKENSLPHFNITIGATQQVPSFLAGPLSAYFSKQTLTDCLQSRKWRNLGLSYQPMTTTNPYQYWENSKPLFVQKILHAEPTIHMMTSAENSIIGWEASKKLKILSPRDITINGVNIPRGESSSILQALLGEQADLIDGLGQLND